MGAGRLMARKRIPGAAGEDERIPDVPAEPPPQRSQTGTVMEDGGTFYVRWGGMKIPLDPASTARLRARGPSEQPARRRSLKTAPPELAPALEAVRRQGD